MEDKQKIYIAGGVGIVVVLLFLMRKNSSGATVITSPTNVQQPDPNQTVLAQRSIDSDLFKTVTGLVYQDKALQSQANTQLSQIEASRQVGLAQTSAAVEVAKAQSNLQLQAIQASRDVGLAQAQAGLSQAQAQARANTTTGILSTIGNILRNLLPQQTQPQQARQSSGGSSGVSGASGGVAPRQAPVRRNPNLPPAMTLEGVDLAGLTAYFGGPPEVTFPDYTGGFGNFGDFAPDIPSFIPQQGSGTFYVEDPSFTPTGIGGFDLPSGGFDFGSIDPAGVGGFGPYNPVPDFGEPPDFP